MSRYVAPTDHLYDHLAVRYNRAVPLPNQDGEIVAYFVDAETWAEMSALIDQVEKMEWSL